MKKALIPALLIVSATFTSSLPWQFAFPARAADVAAAVAGPLARALFWQLCDELLTREFAPSTGSAPNIPKDHSAILSIPLYLVRRMDVSQMFCKAEASFRLVPPQASTQEKESEQ